MTRHSEALVALVLRLSFQQTFRDYAVVARWTGLTVGQVRGIVRRDMSRWSEKG